MDSFFDGKADGGVRGGRANKKRDPKKEDRAAFLARTQAQRESRQHTRQENHAATKLQAMFRRARDLTAARVDLGARLDAALGLPPADTWKHTSSLVRLICLARPAGPTRSEVLRAVTALTASLTTGSGDSSYARLGLLEHAGVVQLQLQRICGYVVAEMVQCRWTLQPRERQEEDVALLKALFVLTDSAQWKAAAGIPAAAKVCSELVGSLIIPAKSRRKSAGAAAAGSSNSTAAGGGGPVEQAATLRDGGLYASLRHVLCPDGGWKGSKGTAQAPLLWTLAIRPLTAGFPGGDARQVWVAFAFAKDILSIPAVVREMPPVLLTALLHQSVWPRVVFSLGTAAEIHPVGGAGAGGWLPEGRVLDVMCNLVELTDKAPVAGLQLLYLSALQRLVEALPGGALALPAHAPRLGQLAPLQAPKHVHWLLCGLGGEVVASGQTIADPSKRAGDTLAEGALKTLKYSDWVGAYREARSKRNSAGQPQFTEGITYFCTVYGLLLRAWPAGNIQMLNAMSFESPVHVALWAWLRATALLQAYIDTGAEQQLVGAVVFVFCRCYLHRLMVTDDTEFYDQQFPFPLAHLVDMALMLRQYVNRRFWAGEVEAGSVAARIAAAGGQEAAARELRQLHREAATGLLHQLYDRNARREFCPLDTWLQQGMKMDAFDISSTDGDSRTLVILREFPHVIPLRDRVRKFQDLIEQDRRAAVYPETHVKIRRQHVVEDGFSKLGGFRSELKGVVKVHFVNESGLDESGIDMGGLYKEFLTTLIERAFHPDYGLFRFSVEHQLYPNPYSHVVHNHLEYLAFLGRMLGKAMFDGIQMDLPFCGFFLSKLLGKHNYLDELPSLDPALHKNLMLLKNYEGDVADMCLDFTVTNDELGGGGVHELVPGGGALEVTASNRIQYIHLVADYRLNKQIRQQCQAFLRGFQDVIRVEWIRFFNPVELQLLISGERNGDFDVSDLRAHTVYSGGYLGAVDGTIRKFWKVVESLTPKEKSLLLKFVTSCPRAPLLGFQSLQVGEGCVLSCVWVWGLGFRV